MTSFLERLTDLEAKATPGLWYTNALKAPVSIAVSVAPLADVRGYKLYASAYAWNPSTSDGALMAFLRNAVPEVKALIEAAQRIDHDAESTETRRGNGELVMAVRAGLLDDLQRSLDALNRLEVSG